MRLVLAAACLFAGPALALDCPSVTDDGERLACWDAAAGEGCAVTDWTAAESSIGGVKLSGAASCKAGLVTIRLYDGDRFVGAGQAVIEGFAFQAYIDGQAADPRPLFSISE